MLVKKTPDIVCWVVAIFFRWSSTDSCCHIVKVNTLSSETKVISYQHVFWQNHRHFCRMCAKVYEEQTHILGDAIHTLFINLGFQAKILQLIWKHRYVITVVGQFDSYFECIEHKTIWEIFHSYIWMLMLVMLSITASSFKTHLLDRWRDCLYHAAWWRHQMETFSALLALCAGNSPVPGEFPPQRPVTRSFDVFCDLCLNNRLSKQSWGWWFETQSGWLWRHCNGISEISKLSIPSALRRLLSINKS